MRDDFIEQATKAVEKIRVKWNIRIRRDSLSLEEEVRLKEAEKNLALKSQAKEKEVDASRTCRIQQPFSCKIHKI